MSFAVEAADKAAEAGPSVGAAAAATPPPTVDMSRLKSSAASNMWSRRNPLWRKFAVKRPRMPDNLDDPSDNITWDRKHFPSSLDDFTGNHNTETMAYLNNLVANRRMRNLIINGPAGSGKTAVIEVFLKEFVAAVAQERENPTKPKTPNTPGKNKFRKAPNRKRALPEPVLRLQSEDAEHMSKEVGVPTPTRA